jgi:hypothetical protein
MKTKSNNKTIWYVVVVVAILNVVAFFSEKNWSSLGILVLASGVTYAVKPDRTLALVAGIIVANLYKATAGVHEGMTGEEAKKRRAKSKKPTDKAADEVIEDEPSEADDEGADKASAEDTMEPLTAMFSGSEKSLEGLMDRQNQLMVNLKNMQPIMAQAQQMMAHLPKDFMTTALKKLTAKNNLPA